MDHMLGAPIGNSNFFRSKLEASVEKIQKIVKMLPNIQDPHTHSLYYCGAALLFLN